MDTKRKKNLVILNVGYWFDCGSEESVQVTEAASCSGRRKRPAPSSSGKKLPERYLKHLVDNHRHLPKVELSFQPGKL